MSSGSSVLSDTSYMTDSTDDYTSDDYASYYSGHSSDSTWTTTYKPLPRKQRSAIRFMSWAAGAPPYATGLKRKTRDIPDHRSIRSVTSTRSVFQEDHDNRLYWITESQPRERYIAVSRPMPFPQRQHGSPVYGQAVYGQPAAQPQPPAQPMRQPMPQPHVKYNVAQTVMQEPAITQTAGPRPGGTVPVSAFRHVNFKGPLRQEDDGMQGNMPPQSYWASARR
jgi:hypothetical protein